jgi:multicomponent Na+:H+ antiporter subunit D
VKTNLFLVSGVVRLIGGSYRLADLGGIYRGHPWLSILFLVPALSLAGVPPLSGFWAKLLLVWAGFEAGQGVIVATALFVSLLTLFSMTKIWGQVFWEAAPPRAPESAASAAEQTEPGPPYGDRRLLFAPIVALASATVLIGLGAEPIYLLARRAAEQLMNPEAYILAVLGASS